MRRLHIASCVLVLMVAGPALALTAAGGHTSQELYTTDGSFTLLGGLALDDGKLYFGNYTAIRTIDLSNGSLAQAGSLPHNVETSMVARHDGLTYAAYAPTYGFTVDYPLGYIAGGSFVQQAAVTSVYDVAVNSRGECYIVANPAGQASKIYRYDWASGATAEVADMGGYSGPIAFDPADNLYYAHQTSSQVLQFTDAQLQAAQAGPSVLGVSDGLAVASVASAGYLAFDSQGVMYATTGFTTLAKFDVSTGLRLGDVAYGSSLGKIAIGQDAIYIIDTDWNNWYSTLNAVSVPEPASLLLLGLGGCAVLARRRRTA